MTGHAPDAAMALGYSNINPPRMGAGGICGKCGRAFEGTSHICGVNTPAVPTPPSFQPRPWKCPICGGKGHVPVDFYTAIGYSTSTNPVLCKSCGGRGVIIA